MLLMPASKHDFPALAAGVADAFFQGVPLEDGVVEAARRAELTPEEVKRLVEGANTAVSVRLLRSDNDRKAVFDLAASANVLARTHPGEQESPPAPVYRGLPDTAGQSLGKAASLGGLFGLCPETVKTASRAPAAAPLNPLREVRRLRLRLEEARRKKAAAELSVRESIDRLASDFMGRGKADFSKFASDALGLCGECARPVLKAMAVGLRLPIEFEKTAGVIDDRQPRLRAFSEICGGLSGLTEGAADIARLREELDVAWRKAVRGETSC